jgi:glutamyl-tRNA reductase
MSLISVGVSHRHSPLALLERLAMSAEQTAAIYQEVAASRQLAECVVLSTCNRVEVYAEVSAFHEGVSEISGLLSQSSGVPLPELSEALEVRYDEQSVRHLFELASGLDSMVLGEEQILGQVRAAMRAGYRVNTPGSALGELFRQSIRVARRVRAGTDLPRAGRSIVTVAVAEAARLTGSLRDRPAVVVGAGSMSALAVSVLHRAGAAPIVVANRTKTHAQRLATTVSGRGVSLEHLDHEIAAADVVVCCTGSVGPVVTVELLNAARAARPTSRVLLDLALPRDVEPAVGRIPGVHLIDLDAIGALSSSHAASDVSVVRQQAESIVDSGVSAFRAWRRATAVAPTVVALRAMADDIVALELVRLAGKLPDLDDRARAEIARAVRRVVDKLLHSPTVRVQELAGEPTTGSYALALSQLFDLRPEVPWEPGSRPG